MVISPPGFPGNAGFTREWNVMFKRVTVWLHGRFTRCFQGYPIMTSHSFYKVSSEVYSIENFFAYRIVSGRDCRN